MHGCRLFLFFAERTVVAVAITSFRQSVRHNGAVTGRAELIRRAQAHGVAVSYQNWRGRVVEVADETLAAVLEALDDERCPAAAKAPTAGAVAPFPRHRSWGFAVQLYSVRSRGSWGHGDLRDLADLAAWSGTALGADFVLVNPLHAAEPTAPISPSPYLAMTRRHLSPLYLRIEDVPEYARLGAGDRARVDALGAPLRAASQTAALIDRDAVWAAKRAALEIIRAAGLSPERQAELDAFRARDPEAVQDWATWCAIAEVHGPDWRTWPGALADPRSAEVAALRRARADRVEFHAWLQWLTAEQAAAAQRAARQAGMSASGRRRRLGRAGRDRHRHERRRAAGRVQPARPGLDAAPVAPRLAGCAGRPAAGRARRGHHAERRGLAHRPRHGVGPAVVDTRRDGPRPGHLRAL
jgi:hypothetical protein